MTKLFACGTALVLLASTGAGLAEPAHFDTPDAAVAAVVAALDASDQTAALKVFGPENKDLLTTDDPVGDKLVWAEFLANAKILTDIELADPDHATLYTGNDRFPFPVPLVRKDGSWSFDAAAGREEIHMRRIGLDELAVIDIMHRIGPVQEAFRQEDHDGDGVREFASVILSTPGKRDGLYWPDEAGTEHSPLGDFVARANASGYNFDGKDHAPDPYVGYYFRILQAQGPAAPGGAYSYMIGGNMVAGFALLAYPADYGETGIMTFMVSENGVVYQADLGKATLATAAKIEKFNPTKEWSPVK